MMSQFVLFCLANISKNMFKKVYLFFLKRKSSVPNLLARIKVSILSNFCSIIFLKGKQVDKAHDNQIFQLSKFIIFKLSLSIK